MSDTLSTSHADHSGEEQKYHAFINLALGLSSHHWHRIGARLPADQWHFYLCYTRPPSHCLSFSV